MFEDGDVDKTDMMERFMDLFNMVMSMDSGYYYFSNHSISNKKKKKKKKKIN